MGALAKILKSYVYEEYADDDDIQAFAKVFNDMSQDYLDTVNELGLPVYTQDPVSGALLDWVAEGLYGLKRPVLPTVTVGPSGPFGSVVFGAMLLDGYAPGSASDIYYTNDDIFRRVITWHFFKGDGKIFNIRWLKRRVMRFLFGEDGVNFNVDQTYRISVILGVDGEVNIRIINVLRTVTGGSYFNGSLLGELVFDGLESTVETFPTIPAAYLLQQAFASGALEFPFQFTVIITQGGIVQFH